MAKKEITIKPTAWDEEEDDKLVKRMGVVLDLKNFRDNSDTKFSRDKQPIHYNS